MKVISTNIAKPTLISWRGKQEKTGIYKKPVSSIFLEKEAVKGDEISNRKVHGGEFKACYLFSSKHYQYWKERYRDLDWEWGMFGENLTIEGLDENEILIGDIYKIGDALVQITQPREPCYKFGIKFGDQKVLQEFVDHGYPGTYVRVLEEGEVKPNDEMTLVERSKHPITTRQFFSLLFKAPKDQELIKIAIENDALPLYKRDRLKVFLE
ncbi:MOSC domain-containing protein [Spongiivirga citrea]|uniref:MOSC domain-containing protein n=1 Tax=Spongiivirga citrea TaxID=1481457 RepID=A0A6M0CIZ4_9FLAO|nr:MOSC domain-containing protein [Spongiivirga citrea]NER17916.1 MOSC domain-containing protein [Spongiivirga citrea]